MKLKPADIDRIFEENVGKPQGSVSAHDFAEQNAKERDALVEGLMAYTSQSTAREGQVLPPPPRSLTTRIEGPNDFGIATVNGTHNIEKEAYVVPLPPALRGGDLDKIACRADLIQ